jgi:hypothetical protein
VEISSNVTLRYPTASEDTLIESPVRVEKKPSMMVKVDILDVDTISVSISINIAPCEETKIYEPIIVE